MNKSSTFLRFSLLGYVGVAVLVSAECASAQTAAPAGGADGEVLDEVVVSGFRSSLEKSLEKKRAAVNFVDSISADDVGKFRPDNNLAEAIARIPGVQISRTNGEGQQINLRGLGPSFTRVTLDGMPISVASEGGVDQAARNREFDFDLLPSDLFSSLEVAKSPPGEPGRRRPCRHRQPAARTSLLALRRSRCELQAPRRVPVDSPEEVDRAPPSSSAKPGTTSSDPARTSASKRTFRTDWLGSHRAGTHPAASARRWKPDGGRDDHPGHTRTPTQDMAAVDRNLAQPAAQQHNYARQRIHQRVRLTTSPMRNRTTRPSRSMQIGTRDRVGASFAMQYHPNEKVDLTFDALFAVPRTEFDRLHQQHAGTI